MPYSINLLPKWKTSLHIHFICISSTLEAFHAMVWNSANTDMYSWYDQDDINIADMQCSYSQIWYQKLTVDTNTNIEISNLAPRHFSLTSLQAISHVQFLSVLPHFSPVPWVGLLTPFSHKLYSKPKSHKCRQQCLSIWSLHHLDWFFSSCDKQDELVKLCFLW